MKLSVITLLFVAVLSVGGCATAVMGGAGRDGNTSVPARHGDAQLAAQVTRALVRAPELPAMDIKVSARHGTVLLEGTVPDRQLRYRAEAVARGVRGVEQVINRLMVAP